MTKTTTNKTAKKRVEKERNEVFGRKALLENFIVTNKNFKKLDSKMRFLLRLQLFVMKIYIKILEKRLKIWGCDND